MDLFLQFLANGLVSGSFYALSALGLTLILGLMRVVNFAHGELYMLGGVLGWFVTARLGLDFFSGLLLVAVVMGAFGWLVDRFLIERIRDQGEEAGILLTIGLSIFLANTALVIAGTAPLKVASPVPSAFVSCQFGRASKSGSEPNCRPSVRSNAVRSESLSSSSSR